MNIYSVRYRDTMNAPFQHLIKAHSYKEAYTKATNWCDAENAELITVIYIRQMTQYEEQQNAISS